MSPGDIFILGVQWIHTLAGVAWVGGSLFYLLVIRPALHKNTRGSDAFTSLATGFRAVVDIAVIVLIITGVVLAFDRLTSRYTDVPYVSVLGIKVALSLWMFWLAGVIQKRRHFLVNRPTASVPNLATSLTNRVFASANLIAIIGIIVFLLSDLLQALFEDALKAV
ncbi:MAG: hypothetical protein VX724_01405 [Chloroflexota bacterium]|nr:hypothetical protein [Chloroflexota bacterium]